MAKTYFFRFTAGAAGTNTGLSPTFLIFSAGATAITPPGFTETPTGQGIYSFSYGPTQAVAYLIDGSASLSSSDRYIAGVLDPIQVIDQQLGYSTDSFGSTSADPGSIWGYFKRFVEHWEGDQKYTKATGLWQMFNRGSTTLLRSKQLTNTYRSSTRTGSS